MSATKKKLIIGLTATAALLILIGVILSIVLPLTLNQSKVLDPSRSLSPTHCSSLDRYYRSNFYSKYDAFHRDDAIENPFQHIDHDVYLIADEIDSIVASYVSEASMHGCKKECSLFFLTELFISRENCSFGESIINAVRSENDVD
jgi:hypothetical protein